MLDWARQPCVEDGIKEGKFSMKGFRVLQALSNDMKHIFYDVRAIGSITLARHSKKASTAMRFSYPLSPKIVRTI